jgi:hypothetical protein
MHKTRVFAAAAFALLLVAACGSSGNYGDILNGGSRTYDIHGTVDSIDTNGHSILLTNVSGYNNSLAGGGGYGNTVRIYYDDRTSISYQGRTYRPEDLERGDQVTVHVNDNGNNQLIAQSMDVTYDARGGMASSSPSSPTYGNGSVITGTIRSIDTSRHTMSVDAGYGSYVTVDWVSNTPVYFNGRTYAPGDLEVGDQVNVRVSGGNGSRVSAQDITVTRSISGTGSNNGTYSNGIQTVRGTVRYIDTAARTIQLESTSWMNGFQTNTGGNTITIRYDPTARVDVSGQLYPLSNLERGDVIDVTLEANGSSNYLAQRITLVRNVRQ